jgi:hypothetical protein
VEGKVFKKQSCRMLSISKEKGEGIYQMIIM